MTERTVYLSMYGGRKHAPYKENTSMPKLELSQWDLLAIEVALRKLQASGEVDRISLGFLMNKIAEFTLEK